MDLHGLIGALGHMLGFGWLDQGRGRRDVVEGGRPKAAERLQRLPRAALLVSWHACLCYICMLVVVGVAAEA